MKGKTLIDGLTIRQPQWEDLEAVTEMVIATELVEMGESDITVEELRDEWKKPRFNIETDAWIAVVTENGSHERIVGYEELWNQEGHALLSGDGYVHPDFKGRGVGTALLHTLEARAYEHIPLAEPGVQVVVRNGMVSNDVDSRQLHENEGYQPVRYFWRMVIDMSAPPPSPEWPQGLSIRNFTPGQDNRAVFDAMEEAFQDHWSYTPWDYNWWLQNRVGKENFDPTLWFLAIDGDQIAGGSLCRYKNGSGWVNQLAVRRPWRRSGLGMALLLHSFGEFYRRGMCKVGLGVDAANPTGATRLYEKAGMSVEHEFVVYEKELRPGEKVASD